MAKFILEIEDVKDADAININYEFKDSKIGVEENIDPATRTAAENLALAVMYHINDLTKALDKFTADLKKGCDKESCACETANEPAVNDSKTV